MGERAENIGIAAEKHEQVRIIYDKMMNRLIVKILKAICSAEARQLLDLYNKLQNWCRCCHCGPVEHEN